MKQHSLTVVFTYDHTSGTFHYTAHGVGQPTQGRCIAAEATPIPIKLRMELHALARRQVDLAAQLHQAREKTLGSPELTQEEYEAKLDEYLAAGGIVQKAGRKREPKITDITLADLNIEGIEI